MVMQIQIDSEYLKNPTDQEAVANAKLTLAIIGLAQEMRYQIPLHGISSLGALFCPLFLLCPQELHLACGKFLQSTLEYTEDELAQSLGKYAPSNYGSSAQEDYFPSFSSADGEEEDFLYMDNLFDHDAPSGHNVEPTDDKHRSLIARIKIKRDKIAMLIGGHEGYAWLNEVLINPTSASRQLFAAATHLLRSFISEGEAQTSSGRGKNIELLQAALNLDSAEVRFLDLADTLQRSTLENDVFSSIIRPLHIRRALTALCGFDQRKKRGLLDSDGMLQSSGLFSTFNWPSDLGDMLNLSELGQTLLGKPFYSIEEMASAVLRPFKMINTQRLEWPHLKMESSLLLDALDSALEAQEPGINILLHGQPGTGKTEFANYLCKQLKCAAYAIAATRTNGDEAKREDRLHSLLLSQRIAGDASRTVLVVDEAEDIFQSSYNNPWAMFAREERTGGKGWTNQLLESNKHPVIWISNKIDHLDPAYVRRFAYVMEFQTLPRAQRLAVAVQHLQATGATASLLQRVSQNTRLTPAMLASAAKFTILTNKNKKWQDVRSSSASIDDVVQHHITTQIKALGLGATGNVPDMVTRFDMRYLNIRGRTSAENVTNALVRTLCGSAVFSGPPGTGKTQLAAHIAERANLELLYRTASDINTMWFGESERNVARLFEECDVSRQMILLDEADTLLMARSPDAHRPERAVTTEFLRHLEAFKGIFICATNHSDIFDTALMRRFVFRLEFLPLTTEQRSHMFAELALDFEPDSPSLQSLSTTVTNALCKLDRLTAGDFANVKKRFASLAQVATADEWLIELAQEQEAKGDRVNSPMGFVR